MINVIALDNTTKNIDTVYYVKMFISGENSRTSYNTEYESQTGRLVSRMVWGMRPTKSAYSALIFTCCIDIMGLTLDAYNNLFNENNNNVTIAVIKIRFLYIFFFFEHNTFFRNDSQTLLSYF